LELNLEAFAKLSQQDRDLIDRLSNKNIREVSARRDIIREGERPGAVILILEGWACRYKQLPDGRRQIVHFFLPGDLCDANIFILKEMDHSIGAITRVRFSEISPTDFEEMMAQSPRITRALWQNELVNAAVAREWVANVGQRTAYEALAHIFCEMFLRLKSAGLAEGDSCEWPLTQSDLADATGLTAVHVNRTLQELRRAGLIELSGKRLTILNLPMLMRVSLFNPNYLHLDFEKPSSTVH
jgi:CRP-like cAMP-binding protein